MRNGEWQRADHHHHHRRRRRQQQMKVNFLLIKQGGNLFLLVFFVRTREQLLERSIRVNDICSAVLSSLFTARARQGKEKIGVNDDR